MVRLVDDHQPEPPADPDAKAPVVTKVDLWNYHDPLIQPMQKVRDQQERERTYRAVVHLSDKRFVQLAGQAIYEQLLEHGVRIWHYQPTMLHAKIMTVDGLVANVGSANFNARSTELDEEINLVALDPDLVRQLDRQFDVDLERSEEIQPGRWEDRSVGRRVLEGITRPLRHKM